MRRYRFTVLVLVISLLASLTSLAVASPVLQTPRALNIGVIGSLDGPMAQGLLLAVQRLSANGPITGTGGAAYTFSVVAADARTPADVANAINQLKGTNVVAIFGPDDDQLASQGSAALAGAGVPVFTAATTTDLKLAANIFRTRAADNWQVGALVEVLLTDLNKGSFAIFQGDSGSAGAVRELMAALTKRGKTPAQPVIQVEGGKIEDSAAALMNSNPDTIIAFGEAQQMADLDRALQVKSFAGTFVTNEADNPAFIRAVPDQLRNGIYGVTTWPYSWDAADSAAFTRDYVALFGQIPTPLSAAAYDAAVALIISIKGVGIAPDAIQAKLLSLPKANSIQGSFNPKVGNNALTANRFVIVTGRYGAPTLVARFDETGRLKLSTTPPTATPRPTLVPSATPEGVVATVKNNVNVRTGPGTIYPVIGQLKRNEQVPLVGASADFKWLVIDFRQQPGWIQAAFVSVFGDVRSLPVVAPPPTPVPTPTPPATFTPSPVPFADLVMLSATLNPTVPEPGVPFSLAVVVKNQGSADAGQFAVASTFEPGNVYTAAIVPGLPAGQQTTVILNATVNGTAVTTIAVVLDLNNQVNEGPNGEANDKPEISYRIDRPRIASGTIAVAPGNSPDLQGGTADLSYDGTKLAPINGAKLGALPGVQLSQVHYDFLSPGVINNTTGIARAELVQGLVIGVYTAEGKRAVIRVAGYAGDTIQLEFYVYNS